MLEYKLLTIVANTCQMLPIDLATIGNRVYFKQILLPNVAISLKEAIISAGCIAVSFGFSRIIGVNHGFRAICLAPESRRRL